MDTDICELPADQEERYSWIVTGVRFELKDKMIHVQIEEGKLLPTGQIEKNSVHLVELGDFTYLTDVSGGGFTMQDGDSTVTLKEGTDYWFIRFGRRDVNLDIVHAREPDYVVTGLKVSRDPENDQSVQLDVHITPFDFKAGLLTPTSDKPSKWISYRDMPDHDKGYNKREWVDLKTAKFSPFKFYDNLPTEHDFAVTWFQHTYGYEEIGHNTVPFFDRQLVAPYPRVPLTGVSLYLRINDGDSGGFFAFNLLTYDISRYLNPTMSPENVELFKDKPENQIMNHFVELE
ncbi:Protein of unknown function [Cotesia congregata]|uniref:Uncharacterized protein n=1 Tax=Cotesia congregata TaxID=51543 RepID=A0A8J2H0L1_COTCN|nr:Protein of unknown function [Cotesia congregata]